MLPEQAQRMTANAGVKCFAYRTQMRSSPLARQRVEGGLGERYQVYEAFDFLLSFDSTTVGRHDAPSGHFDLNAEQSRRFKPMP
jgi:hypothetical protein